MTVIKSNEQLLELIAQSTETDTQTDERAYVPLSKQTDMWKFKEQTDKQTHRQTRRETDRRTNVVYLFMYGQTNRLTDKTGGLQAVKSTGRQKNKQTNLQSNESPKRQPDVLTYCTVYTEMSFDAAKRAPEINQGNIFRLFVSAKFKTAHIFIQSHTTFLFFMSACLTILCLSVTTLRCCYLEKTTLSTSKVRVFPVRKSRRCATPK